MTVFPIVIIMIVIGLGYFVHQIELSGYSAYSSVNLTPNICKLGSLSTCRSFRFVLIQLFIRLMTLSCILSWRNLRMSHLNVQKSSLTAGWGPHVVPSRVVGQPSLAESTSGRHSCENLDSRDTTCSHQRWTSHCREQYDWWKLRWYHIDKALVTYVY